MSFRTEQWQVKTAPDGRQVPFLACGEAAVPSVADLLAPSRPSHQLHMTSVLKISQPQRQGTCLTAELTVKTRGSS